MTQWLTHLRNYSQTGYSNQRLFLNTTFVRTLFPVLFRLSEHIRANGVTVQDTGLSNPIIFLGELPCRRVFIYEKRREELL